MKFRQIINELNVIDQEPVDTYLKEFKSRTPAIANWLKTKAKSYILNSERDMTSIDPDSIDLTQAPTWLKTAVERGDELYEFDPSQELKEEIKYILDYLNSDAFDQMNKLNKISFAQAKQMSDNWHHQLANPSKKELERRRKRQLDDSDFVKPIYVFKDGYRIVELPNDVCKKREGELMGHCVGDENYRDNTILSLRDNKNEPHATMDISQNDPFLIVELQGKENQDVSEKYWPYVREFINQTEYRLDPYYLKKIGLIEIDGNTYELDDIPEGTTIVGNLNLSETKISRLPKNLTVTGSLDLSNTKITHIPDDLTVGGSLYLSYTKITQLPDGLKFGGSLGLSYTKITQLPNWLKTVKGDLNLSNTKITQLPDGLTVGGNLVVHYTTITQLPNGLTVSGSLDLRNSKITHLPDGLKVGLGLYLSNTNITRLPKNLTVGGDLDLRDSKITQLSNGLSVGGNLYLRFIAITHLPDDLKVGGSLNLANTKITQLPDGLTVGRNLDLSYTPITRLPDGLKVGGSLDLTHTKIAHLPDSLKVGRLLLTTDSGITREEYNRWKSSQK